ncbi:MAG: STAS domain-containing protein [Kibdelosporangium sp.]
MAPKPHVLRIRLAGDVDFETAAELQQVALEQVEQRPLLRELHIDCAAVRAIDSTGLSVLLMIRRLADEADVRLHLDNRPATVDRVLNLTGTLRHLTGADRFPNGG